MTVCIAALCEGGKSCVVAADREITVGLPLNINFDHGERKIEQVAGTMAVLSSGNALLCAELAGRLRTAVAASGGARPEVQKTGGALRDLYMQVHLERAESVILRPRGLTFDEFKLYGAQRLPLPIYQQIDQLFFNFTLNTEFILVGVDTTGGHIGWIHYHGMQGAGWLEWFDKLGYQAIGSGSSHAGVLLALANQHSQSTLPETIYNVYRAKRSAEVAPGVGPATDMAVITDAGVEFLNQSFLDKLKETGGQIGGDTSAIIEQVRDLFDHRRGQSNE